MPGICTSLAGSVLAAATATLATAAPASAQAPTPPIDPGVGAPTMVACGVSYPAAQDLRGVANFPANTVTMRSGPSDACIQTGLGTHDQLAQYVCSSPGDGGNWTFLRNVSTGDQGWVRDALLAGNGSEVPCDENMALPAVNPLDIGTILGLAVPVFGAAGTSTAPTSPTDLQGHNGGVAADTLSLLSVLSR